MQFHDITFDNEGVYQRKLLPNLINTIKPWIAEHFETPKTNFTNFDEQHWIDFVYANLAEISSLEYYDAI